MAARPLSMVAAGEEAVVVEIRGGRGLQERLSSMGLAQGKRVRVIKSIGCGPMLVAIDNVRLAVGRGQSHHVMVEPCVG